MRNATCAVLLAILASVANAQLGLTFSGPKGYAFTMTVMGIVVTEKKCANDYSSLSADLEKAFSEMTHRNAKVIPPDTWINDGLTPQYVDEKIYGGRPGPSLAECNGFTARLKSPEFDASMKNLLEQARHESEDRKEHP